MHRMSFFQVCFGTVGPPVWHGCCINTGQVKLRQNGGRLSSQPGRHIGQLLLCKAGLLSVKWRAELITRRWQDVFQAFQATGISQKSSLFLRRSYRFPPYRLWPTFLNSIFFFIAVYVTIFQFVKHNQTEQKRKSKLYWIEMCYGGLWWLHLLISMCRWCFKERVFFSDLENIWISPHIFDLLPSLLYSHCLVSMSRLQEPVILAVHCVCFRHTRYSHLFFKIRPLETWRRL